MMRTGGEVAREALAASPRMAARLGVPIERLYGDLLHLLHDPPPRIAWDEYVRFKDITAELAGTDEALADLGAAVIDDPRTSLGTRALALFVDPNQVILSAAKNGWGRLFSNLDIETCREGDRARVDVRLQPGYAPCRPFFVQNVGILRAVPRLVGAEAADVEWRTDGLSGTYWVRTGPSRTLWSRVKRMVKVLGNTRATIDELTRQQAELNRSNGDLERALRETQAALRSRDRFLQTVDHELRTPLHAIRGGLAALRTAPDDAERVRWIEAMEHSEERLGDVIERVLDLTKLESEPPTPRPREFRPRSLADAMLREAHRRSVETPVELRCDAPRALWVRGDDELLAKIASELIRNALCHSAGAPVTLSVTVEGDALVISVRDQGPGIAPEDQARIFEPFEQLDRGESRAHSGAGLGLALARTLTRALGGTLEVSSKLGGGSTFVLRCQVAPSSRSAAEGPAPALSVVVVDDDKINRMVASRMLSRLGCRVATASDGVEALELIVRSPPDLVLMDCEMPRLDGWATTRALRSEHVATMPIVALTAYTAEADRRRCFAAGMDDFIPKPLSEAALAELLARWTVRPKP